MTKKRRATEVDSRLRPTDGCGAWLRCMGGSSWGPTGVSTRCARPTSCAFAGDSPAVHALRQQLWVIRPHLDRGVPAVDLFTPDARRAVGDWLAVRGHGAPWRPRTHELFGLEGIKLGPPLHPTRV